MQFLCVVIHSICFFRFIHGQYHHSPNTNLGPTQYCADLNAKKDVNIQQISGTWFGNEVITHRDRISSEYSSHACVYVVISEISYELATYQPPTQGEREIVTQLGSVQPRTFGSSTSNSNSSYRYLKLDWTEQNEKLEYILRYNATRKGFWMSGAPHKQTHYLERDQPNYGSFTGTIQVLEYDYNFMVLTFCESVPEQQLFSIILSRRMNSLTQEMLRHLQDSLRNRHLPIIYERKVCSGSNIINGSLFIYIVSFVFITIH